MPVVMKRATAPRKPPPEVHHYELTVNAIESLNDMTQEKQNYDVDEFATERDSLTAGVKRSLDKMITLFGEVDPDYHFEGADEDLLYKLETLPRKKLVEVKKYASANGWGATIAILDEAVESAKAKLLSRFPLMPGYIVEWLSNLGYRFWLDDQFVKEFSYSCLVLDPLTAYREVSARADFQSNARATGKIDSVPLFGGLSSFRFDRYEMTSQITEREWDYLFNAASSLPSDYLDSVENYEKAIKAMAEKMKGLPLPYDGLSWKELPTADRLIRYFGSERIEKSFIYNGEKVNFLSPGVYLGENINGQLALIDFGRYDPVNAKALTVYSFLSKSEILCRLFANRAYDVIAEVGTENLTEASISEFKRCVDSFIGALFSHLSYLPYTDRELVDAFGGDADRAFLQTARVIFRHSLARKPIEKITLKAIVSSSGVPVAVQSRKNYVPGEFRTPTNDYQFIHPFIQLKPGQQLELPFKETKSKGETLPLSWAVFRNQTKGALAEVSDMDINVLFAIHDIATHNNLIEDVLGRRNLVVPVVDIVRQLFPGRADNIRESDTRYQFVANSVQKLMDTRYDTDLTDFVRARKIPESEIISRFYNEPLLNATRVGVVGARGKEYEGYRINAVSFLAQLLEQLDWRNTIRYYNDFMPKNITTADTIELASAMLSRAANHGKAAENFNKVFLYGRDAVNGERALFQEMKKHGWIDISEIERPTAAQRKQDTRQKERVSALLNQWRDSGSFSVYTNITERKGKSLKWYYAKLDRQKKPKVKKIEG